MINALQLHRYTSGRIRKIEKLIYFSNLGKGLITITYQNNGNGFFFSPNLETLRIANQVTVFSTREIYICNFDRECEIKLNFERLLAKIARLI